MAIRLSGMTSGLDTDSIVKAMVSSYTTRKEKYQRRRPSLSGHRMRGNPLIPRCIACTAIFPICDFLPHTT